MVPGVITVPSSTRYQNTFFEPVGHRKKCSVQGGFNLPAKEYLDPKLSQMQPLYNLYINCMKHGLSEMNRPAWQMAAGWLANFPVVRFYDMYLARSWSVDGEDCA